MTQSRDTTYLTRAVEATVRVGAVLLLAAACLKLLWPFLTILAWASIIAIAITTPYRKAEALLGGRRWLAATLATLVLLALLVVPLFPLFGTIQDGVERIAHTLSDGKLEVPPPPDSVQGWPLVGPRLHRAWAMASENLADFLASQQETLRSLATLLLSWAAGLGLAGLHMLASVILAGVLLAHAEGAGRLANAVGTRLGGDAGAASIALARSTIRSVFKGVLGVAAIQSLLAGAGLATAGIPAWGLLSIVCLFLSVAQIGVAPVMIPAAIYLYFQPSLGVAIAFTVWTVVVLAIDNVLKPMLLGRGLDVPMVVIFLGSVGGMLSTGILGLFTGSVVMAVGYRMFLQWLESAPPAPVGEDGAAAGAPGPPGPT